MDIQLLQGLDKMDLVAAKDTAVSLIDQKKTRKVVLDRLISDLSEAPSASEVSRIMWQVYLSGSGLGTIGSTWKKQFRGL
jgi:hypothetical protein